MKVFKKGRFGKLVVASIEDWDRGTRKKKAHSSGKNIEQLMESLTKLYSVKKNKGIKDEQAR